MSHLNSLEADYIQVYDRFNRLIDLMPTNIDIKEIKTRLFQAEGTKVYFTKTHLPKYLFLHEGKQIGAYHIKGVPYFTVVRSEGIYKALPLENSVRKISYTSLYLKPLLRILNERHPV